LRLWRLPGIWASHHLQGAVASLGRLMRTPLPTLMTVAVIGMALALPGGLYALTRNLSLLSTGWEQTAGLSLFLRTDMAEAQAAGLADALRARPEVAEVRLIGPDDALVELREAGAGFADAIGLLGENPLPWVLALQPTADVNAPDALERLREELAGLAEVDLARLDTQWMRRFQAVVDLIRQGVLILGAGLALAVLLVIGNTIRLEIENRRGEIEIMELVGATPAFIRRPFLYAGAWYGLLGGLAAWVLIAVGLLLLQGPVTRLAALYHAQFPLAGLGPLALLALLGGSALLGLLGSWISVNRHLAAIEPH
jgi:cell division transport system permease protein